MLTAQTQTQPFTKEPIMATQTRRTTRRSARFFSATGKAFMVTACCGLVLLGAVAAHAAQSWNGMQLQGMPFNGVLINGIPYNGIGPNGMPRNGIMFQGLVVNGTPLQGVPIQGMPRNGLPSYEGTLPTEERDSLPWSTISQQGIAQPTR